MKKNDDISLLCGVSDTLVFKKVQYGDYRTKKTILIKWRARVAFVQAYFQKR